MARRLSRRKRCCVTVLTVFCLLFQQLALAAYACPLDAAPATAAMADCASDESPEAPRDALCQKHCSPDTATAAEARTATVPALALPPAMFDHVTLHERCGECGGATAFYTAATAPPPTLAFARLLI